METEEIQQPTNEAPPSDPFETPEVIKAANQYASNVKRIRALAKNMKAGGLARVMIAEAEFPFSQNYPKLKGAEQELFVLLLANSKAKDVINSKIKEEEASLQLEAANNETNKILNKGGL